MGSTVTYRHRLTHNRKQTHPKAGCYYIRRTIILGNDSSRSASEHTESASREERFMSVVLICVEIQFASKEKEIKFGVQSITGFDGEERMILSQILNVFSR